VIFIRSTNDIYEIPLLIITKGSIYFFIYLCSKSSPRAKTIDIVALNY
jgi:hypothetical protein